MLNLLLALALTSSISGNDIDIPTPLNTQVETTVDYSTNSDIVSAINETNELLETILAPQTIIDSGSFGLSDMSIAGYSNPSTHIIGSLPSSTNSWNLGLTFPVFSNYTYTLTITCDTSSVYGGCIYSLGNDFSPGTEVLDYTYYSLVPNGVAEITFTPSEDCFFYFDINGDNSKISKSVSWVHSYQQTYSFSDIGDKLVAQERQLDNITFVVIVLLLLPIIKGITNKLTHRKENS